MGSIDEISTLCRLCLVKDQVNKPIFDADSDIKQTFEKINSCLPVKVSPDDDLPKMICDGCFHKLDILYDFRSTSLESEKHLISLLEKAGLKSKPLTNDHESEKPITVKQENIEASDRLSEDENDDNQITDDSQSYIVQQQKLAYQKDFKFSAASGSKLEESVDDPDEPEEPKPKRARRAAALTAIKSLPIETEDDEEEEEDMDGTMEITKEEDEESDTMDNTEFPEGDEVPSTSTEDQQPGPSGVGKNVEAPSFSCGHCGIMFAVEFLLHNHLAEVHKMFVCDYCKEVYLNESDLLCHSIIHRVMDFYHCNLCNRRFTTYRKLISHKYRLPWGITCERYRKIFRCPHCLRVFSAVTSLKWHIKTVHENRQFLCHICAKIIVCDSSFRAHLDLHRGKVKHKCTECGKMWLKKESLTLHLRTHTKEKPYLCDQCGKAFAQAAGRNVHVKNVHGSDKAFKCHLCGKCFGVKCSLTQHLKGHRKK